MRRIALMLFMALTACASNSEGPPSRADNACHIIAERPQWHRAMERTEARWGTPVHVQLATLYHESRFEPRARTPRTYVLGFIPTGRVSSAYGYSQALDGTWDDYRAATGNRGARRDDFHDASDFMGWYMAQTAERNDVPVSDAYRQYLAYHEGHAGFARGSHRDKDWLLDYARQVEARAETYRQQLASCT
jgi:hypothetical protein